MGVEVGAILEGKVTGITKFGAFVSLPEGKSGLVHISEVANSFVNDVHDFVTVGQTVKVKVLNITPDGKINLSIKKAEENPAPHPRQFNEGREQNRQSRPPREYRDNNRQGDSREVQSAEPESADKAFEDKLKKFMQESDSRIADNKIYSEHKQRNRR